MYLTERLKLHYCASAIFFYKTRPGILISTRHLLCKCALLSMFKSISALKEESQIAIDIGSVYQLIWYYYLCLNPFFSYELLFDFLYYYRIYVCVLTTVLYSFHYWMFMVCFSFNHICVDDINDKCSNIALIALFNYLSKVILEWINVHVY